MANILIVDDEASYGKVLKVIFESEGYTVQIAGGGQEALDHLKSAHCDLIISDVRMPDMDGIALLRAARAFSEDIGVVLMTAFGTIATAREAFKLGADDFVQKPFNNEELKLIVKRTLEKQAIIHENRAFRRAQRMSGSIKNIIGKSPQMVELFRLIEIVAHEKTTILITGESGTGKELVARAIHDLSNRAEKPFIPVNCGAIPENLLEAELFGFLKGTFTGAEKSRPGLFEAAESGTLFLDEIGDMPAAMQVKMLRVLQDGRVRPVGASVEIPVNTRVIAATNCDIRQMVEDGTFRRDLYYRLSVIPLQIPPLRERREDIPKLANHFIKKFCAQSDKTANFSKEALQTLQSRSWNGNVRELEHTIERAVALIGCNQEILPEHCTDDFSAFHTAPKFGLPDEGVHLPTFLGNLEKEMVAEALKRTGGNQTRAASLLQIPVHAFRHLLTKHNL